MFIYFFISICRGIVYFSLKIIDCFNDDFIITGKAELGMYEIIEPGKIQAITTSVVLA
jgi:hypothetical protein